MESAVRPSGCRGRWAPPCSPSTSGRLVVRVCTGAPRLQRHPKVGRRRSERCLRAAASVLENETAPSTDSDDIAAAPEDSEEAVQEPGDGGVLLDRQGYASVPMEGCEFLIAQGSDGRLNLDDVYVYDDETGIYARPDKVGEMPPGPRLFQQVQWRHESTGDTVYAKDPVVQIMKVFLIVAPPEEDGMLQLDQVWALEAETRCVSRQEVIRETTVEDPMQLTLRIRDGQLSLEESWRLPSPEDVVQSAETGTEALSRAEEEQNLAEQPMDELEAMQDMYDEPDQPAVDYE